MTDVGKEAGTEAGRIVLDQMQSFRLMLYVDHNRDRIAKSRQTLAELAAEAAAYLKFPVSRANVAGAIKAHGITRETPKAVRPSGGGGYLAAVKEQVAAMREQIDSLLSRVTALENAVTMPGR